MLGRPSVPGTRSTCRQPEPVINLVIPWETFPAKFVGCEHKPGVSHGNLGFSKPVQKYGVDTGKIRG